MDEYYFSGTLSIDNNTYVERPADTLLYQGLKDGKFCYVLNSRQTGKSSLRVRVMERLKQEGWQCTVLDLSLIGSKSSSEEQWYAGMLDRLQKNFNFNIHVGNWWRERELLSPLGRFREFIESILLKEILQNIVIFVDEIDSVLTLGFSTDDFFAFVRACYNQRVDNPEYKRLAFCLLGVAKPSDLIQDKRRTPFNIGYAIELTGIELEYAKGKLTKGLEQKVDDPEGVLAEILKWTGGQPFLTQKLCYLVATQSKSRTPNIQRLVKDKIINNWEFQDNPEHLITIKNRLFKNSKEDPKKTIKLLKLYQKILNYKAIQADKTLEQMELMLSGLVIQQEEGLRVYNPIYREVFNRDWVRKNIKDLNQRNLSNIEAQNQPKKPKSNQYKELNQYIYTLLLWLPLGFFLGITFHFIFNAYWSRALFSAIVTIFISPPVIKFFQSFQEELDLAARIKGKELAKWIDTQISSLISQPSWLTPGFESKYRQSLVAQYRALTTEGYRTGLPVLDLEDIFVPLGVVTEISDKITGAMIRRRRDTGTQDIWQFLAQIPHITAYRCLAVIGAPGSGKTTLLKYLTLSYAKSRQKTYQKYGTPKFIPFLLYLRNIREQLVRANPPNLLQLITIQIRKLPGHQQLIPPPNWVETQLRSGRCLVMLDGLDEVADESERVAVSQWVDRQMATYTETAFILTSRPHGYCNAPLEQVGTVLEVLPFNVAQVKQFIRSWYLQTEIRSRAGRDDPAVREEAKNSAEDLIERIIYNRAISEMAKNPLLVTMIATVHYCGSALPGRRVELYQKICELLLGPRQQAKNIDIKLTAEQNKSVLQVLALALMKRKTRTFTLEEGEGLIQEELEKVAGNRLTPAEFLENEIKRLSGLLVERELGVYEFAHLSFQEYLAAVQVKEMQQDDLLRQNLHEPWWAETIRLYAAQSDATNLIREALTHPTVASLTLAYDCGKEGLKVQPAVAKELDDMLEVGLESDEPAIAKMAAEVKLSWRLNHLFKVDETTAMDTGYITWAEYQLFLEEELRDLRHNTIPIIWLLLRKYNCMAGILFIRKSLISLSDSTPFQPESARHPVTGISLEDALSFCGWLTARNLPSLEEPASDRLIYYYRLPSAIEVQTYPARRPIRLGSWTVGENPSQDKGIRVVQAQLPSQYVPLTNYLAAGEWKKADRETRAVMLKIAHQESQGELDVASIDRIPCQELRLIDQLWVHYSKGRNGLGVQVSIWEAIRGNALSVYLPRLWYMNASGSPRELLSALSQRFIECGIERSLPKSQFEIVTVNRQGQISKREPKQAPYFTETLSEGGTLDLVAIPGGKFLMGSPEGEGYNSERPQHEVTVQPFFMGKFPVTQKQWQAIASLPKVERDLKSDPFYFKGGDRPVEQVSWYDAVEFCKRLSRETGRDYRLPSEAEWEYACRAGTTTPFYFGETITGELANYDASQTYAGESKRENRGKNTPFGQFPPNAFGLYDMHGNVWEWCADTWHENYRGAPTDGSAWTRDGNDNRSPLRGGSWGFNPVHCRSARRFNLDLARDFIFGGVGFRVACGKGRTLSR